MMAVKSVLAALCALALGFALIVFSAANAGARAQHAIAAGAASTSPIVQMRIVDDAIAALEHNWAQPLRWHAGSAETGSGLYALAGALHNDPAAFTKSVRLAERAVTLAPIQPNAWTRLAALSLDGHPNQLCEPRACLARAWEAAPFADPATLCTRLQLSRRAGAEDLFAAHLRDYARAAISIRDKAQCLAPVMAQHDLFATLLAAQADRPRRGR